MSFVTDESAEKTEERAEDAQPLRANMLKQPVIFIVVLFVLAAGTLTLNPGSQVAASSAEAEQILSFNSDIAINPDGALRVDETLKVLATGDQIKHGIYREFPTRYNDRFGNPYVIHFEVVAA